ncbi:uncharacterized protein ARMOST_04626 [Armillaria ostoyae]|uniref:Uncharacterized protein n=1 Tax=Armillaria ostoyae TaxID=47428 RepID=A0A284QXU7_ARMOS|nr:uncharacterized protein ARMOST_04626 [Armillaria ostoyae]
MDASGEIVDDSMPMTGKRKWYNSSDNPMYAWFPFHQDFLDEMLHREEFSNQTLQLQCVTCNCIWQGQLKDGELADTMEELFRSDAIAYTREMELFILGSDIAAEDESHFPAQA